MAIINKEDVRGYIIGDQIVCTNCADENELQDIGIEQVITEAHLDDDMYFCHRCPNHKRL